MKKRKKKAIRILAVLFLGGILICAGIFGIGFVKASAIVKESGRTIFSEKENSYIYGDDGQVLAVHLNNGEPIQNVPRSLKDEGHKVLSVEQNADGSYNLLVEKGGL